ncbi:MAG: DUF1801 domain-containing protein [Acidimicrobiia bacterium]
MPTAIDEYLASVPDEVVRAALEKLRQTIKSVVPDAIEVISYKIPSFKYQGRMLVGFNATKEGCTLHLLSSSVLGTHAADVQGYKTGKGSIRFVADQPLPAALVKKLVRARIAENEARSG